MTKWPLVSLSSPYDRHPIFGVRCLAACKLQTYTWGMGVGGGERYYLNFEIAVSVWLWTPLSVLESLLDLFLKHSLWFKMLKVFSNILAHINLKDT